MFRKWLKRLGCGKERVRIQKERFCGFLRKVSDFGFSKERVRKISKEYREKEIKK